MCVILKILKIILKKLAKSGMLSVVVIGTGRLKLLMPLKVVKVLAHSVFIQNTFRACRIVCKGLDVSGQMMC